MLSYHKFFHWFYYKRRKHHLFNFGTGILIWIILSNALPFGGESNNAYYFVSVFILLPFALVLPLISYSTDYIVKKVFSIKAYQNSGVDLIVLLIKLFLLVHLAFVILNILCFWGCDGWKEYFKVWLKCISVLIIVYVPFSLFARYKFLKKMSGKDPTASDDVFEFIGGGKTTLKLILDEVIYIKSDDNYVDIVTIDKENTQKTHVFRAKIKSVAEQLEDEKHFVRIHRSYIVNLRYLSGLNKNVSLKIRNADWELELPISQKYLKDLLNRVE